MSDSPGESGARTDATRREYLLYALAREFDNDTVVFTGFHWPVVAARLARKLHAPDLATVFEAGIVYRGLPDRLPTSTTDVGAVDRQAEWYGNTLDTLQTFLKSGRLDGAVVDAANVDRFGNVNSSVIGEYDNPSVRLPGPGGARAICAYADDLTLVCGSTDPSRFHERVSYTTSPGHLDGDGTRVAAGFPPGTGPSRLLTPHGRFVFDDGGRAQLEMLYPGVDLAEVRETTGWELADRDYESAPVPTAEDLRVVRSVLAEAEGRGYRSIRP